MKYILIIMFLHIILLENASADTPRAVTVYGVGLESCGTFVTNLLKTNRYKAIEYEGQVYTPKFAMQSHAYSEWVHAYISAFNQFNNKRENIQIPDRSSMNLWLKNWCEANPMKNIRDAAFALVIDQVGYNPMISNNRK